MLKKRIVYFYKKTMFDLIDMTLKIILWGHRERLNYVHKIKLSMSYDRELYS